MMGLLLYLVSLSCIIFASLSVCILCSVKLFQPAGLVNANHSAGAHARMRLIIFIGVSCACRCIFSSLEFIMFAINVVKENRPTASISYYRGFDHSYTSRLLFVCRVAPTLIFLAYYALIGDYFASLFYTIRESHYNTVRICYYAASGCAGAGVLLYLVIIPDPQVLNAVCLGTVLLLAMWILRHGHGINNFYVRNEDVLLETSAIDQGRLLSRMHRVVAVAFVALLSYAVVYCADLNYLLPWRHFYARSALDLSVIFFSEVCCAWVLVSLLSNRLTGVEGKLRQFLNTHAMRLFAARTSGGTVHAPRGGGSVSMVSLGAAQSMNGGGPNMTAAQREELQLLQQQQLLQRYGNYESIPLGELTEP